jgi:hypothetical protein
VVLALLAAHHIFHISRINVKEKSQDSSYGEERSGAAAAGSRVKGEEKLVEK